jgi:hypothetical protein
MSEKPVNFIYDALTGETETKELTAQEIQEREQMAAQSLAIQQEIEAKASARESALAKLSALGLTEAEIAAL